MTLPHRHKDNSYIVDHSIHTPVNHQQLGSVGVFNSTSGKNLSIFRMVEIFFLMFLLTLGHTWHAYINGNTCVKQQQSIFLCLT